jgi:hypothetical protein
MDTKPVNTIDPGQRGQATVAAVVLVAGVAYATGLRRPLEPAVILPAFLVTAAGFTVHAIEEYLGHYGPAIGRLFGFAWTDHAFVIVILCLVAALSLVTSVSTGKYRSPRWSTEPG